MRYQNRDLCLALAIVLIFLSHAQSQVNTTNNLTAIPEPPAMIDVSSEVYETNSNAIATFDDTKIEPAKQEVYRINVTNIGAAPLNDVIVSINALEGMIFKNSAYYDDLGHPKRECDKDDLCKGDSTKLIRYLGTLNSSESKSILINAYVKPKIDNRQINVKVTGGKPNGAISDLLDRAELAKCMFVDHDGVPCGKQKEGCICKAPDWIDVFDVTKPLIQLKQINVTNKVIAIKTFNQEWNTNDFKSYSPNVADKIMYQISISNTNSIDSLKDIRVVNTLPDGMIYVSSSITNDQGKSQQILPSNVSENKITWKIDEIGPGSQVLIKYIAAFLENKPPRFENKVYAIGIWDTEYASIEDRSQEVSSVIPL